MKYRTLAVTLAVLVYWTGGEATIAQDVFPADPQPAGGLPSLGAVRWAGAPISFEELRGKSVVLLVYATWCPKANAWSGELFSQLKEAIKDKPVVVLAINADDSPTGVQSYLTQRGFFAPNIFHGHDPTMHRKLGFQSNLYNYVLVGPEGAVKGRGTAASFFRAGAAKQFVVPRRLAESKQLGSFDFIAPEMSDEVKLLFWPWELGHISETAVRSAQRKLDPEQREQIDAAIARYLDRRIEKIRSLYKGSVPERIEAYETATALSGMFRATAQSRKAKQVVTYMKNDRQFKRELAAKKVYDEAMKKVDASPKQRIKLLRTVARRFEGTHYGKLAEEALAADSP